MLVYISDDEELNDSCDDDYSCEESYDYDYDSQNQSYDYVESDDNCFD